MHGARRDGRREASVGGVGAGQRVDGLVDRVVGVVRVAVGRVGRLLVAVGRRDDVRVGGRDAVAGRVVWVGVVVVVGEGAGEEEVEEGRGALFAGVAQVFVEGWDGEGLGELEGWLVGGGGLWSGNGGVLGIGELGAAYVDIFYELIEL